MAAAARCHAQVTGQAEKGAIHRANGFGVERKDEAAGIGGGARSTVISTYGTVREHREHRNAKGKD